MASVYDLKPRFQDLLRPLCRSIAAAGGTANQVTVAAAALSGAVGLVCAMGSHPARWLLLPAVLLVRMGLNAIDGMLAREYGQKSRLGAVLNELGDVVSDAALYLPLAFVGTEAVREDGADWLPIAVVLFVVAAILTEMTGVLALAVGADRNYAGPMGKSDRAVVVGVLGLLLGLGWVGAETTAWVAAIAGLLAVVTVINRARQSLAAGHAAEVAATDEAAGTSSSHVLG